MFFCSYYSGILFVYICWINIPAEGGPLVCRPSTTVFVLKLIETKQTVLHLGLYIYKSVRPDIDTIQHNDDDI